MSQSKLTDRGWTEPLNESPFDLPEGWEGGAVVNTGGGIYCRIWRNEEQRVEVVYGLDHKVVEADRLVEDDDYGLFNNGDVLEHIEVDEVTDETKADAAEELVKKCTEN